MTLLTHTSLVVSDDATLLDHAHRLAANPSSWAVRPRFDPAGRWYARLANTDRYEAWLITWLPGQQTDWHDHGGSAGAFAVVSGVLLEDTRSGTRTIAAGSGRRFGARHVHRVVNDGDTAVVSVHLYAPALRSMTRYDMVGGELRIRSVERAGADW